MDKILEMLNKAMNNARILAIVEFDPGLFLFTSALQALIHKGQDYLARQKSNKKTGADLQEWKLRATSMLDSFNVYLATRTRMEGERT